MAADNKIRIQNETELLRLLMLTDKSVMSSA